MDIKLKYPLIIINKIIIIIINKLIYNIKN